jgi:hypothetical protein
MSLEEIVNAVRALPPKEQAELRRRLEALTENPKTGNVNLTLFYMNLPVPYNPLRLFAFCKTFRRAQGPMALS